MANGRPFPGTTSSNQTVAESVVTYPLPPLDLEPLSASDEELEQYGFPPRPDPVSAPAAYAHWQKLVSVPRTASPHLTQTTIYNGPALALHVLVGQNPRNGSVSVSSYNWSGYAVVGKKGTFARNKSSISAQWTVPVAQTAFGVCDGIPVYSFQWVGFDGFDSNDVLQAGTEADAYCTGSTTETFYSSWIEWFPNYAIQVGAPATQPGDLMGAEVWYTTTSPFGHAFIVNYTLNQSEPYAFNPPPGTTFVGNSAEWVEERPAVGSGLADLTNYVADQFNNDAANVGSKYFYPGLSPAGIRKYAITMVCPPWTPSSSCPSTTKLSIPHLYGRYTLWFYDSGPALGSGL